MQTSKCFFVTDLHGRTTRYDKLFQLIGDQHPRAVFIGGDIMPLHSRGAGYSSFLDDYLIANLLKLKQSMQDDYPAIFLIPGNDDPASDEQAIIDASQLGIWEYIHNKKTSLDKRPVYGYACVPPTPFRLKDWERYDISRYVDPGCVSPEAGTHTVPFDEHTIKYSTIKNELIKLTGDDDLHDAIILFHSPPYNCSLDRAALDGRYVDHVPLDVHVGSIAIREFIDSRQPLITLHGHIHESARLTGSWMEQFDRTYAFSAAHDGPELALVEFEPEKPSEAVRHLI